ncbi:hypothetical protein NLU13_1068 [Sarocladium strictum]|uniref:Uncharacterized protein n=1 Tax=Sarocladium strictum TaxID=5046 RepID=A0AA39GQ87_SARSR|nr:hypothetical protein NLU13_1068 [Sarocladium strictum]
MPRTRPPIKSGVDLQLQSACSEGNWLVALRLAEKRMRTSKDSYFEILKVCAESQLDDPSTRFAAVAAAWQYAKDGTVIKDVDALDLLEWACQDHLPECDFQETLGTLRARAVKAGLKQKAEAVRCFESCLMHWDLINAQQIAAMMDRTYPQERRFMFWNIVVTHMLSIDSQSPAEKKKLYGMLAQKQIERAAQSAQDNANDAATPAARTVQSEEEILLLYEVVEKHGTSDDLSKLLASPLLGPVPQFLKGRKELLMRTLRRHQRNKEWRAIFDLCQQCLTGGDEKTEEPNYLAADWSILQQFIEAASHLESVKPTAVSTVRTLLLKFAKSTSLRPIYRRNILLARLAAVFTLSPTEGADAKDDGSVSLRLSEIVAYLKDQVLNSACFDDVKAFMEKLDDSGLQWLVNKLHEQLRSNPEDDRRASAVELLLLKMRYYVCTCRLFDVQASSGGIQRTCKICRTSVSATLCHGCLQRIIEDAMHRYQELSKSVNTQRSGILSDLAILVALCYVDTAEISSKPQKTDSHAVQTLYRAVAILEEQLQESPKDSVILLLLVQLHLRIGSAYRARVLWADLGVKRTIVDCIAPILYDRLSTISPSMLARSDKLGYELSECVSSHYEVSLKTRMPRRLIDAIEAESYSSVLQIPVYIENLRTGCTRAMSLVEEARTARLLDGPGGRVLNDPRYSEASDNVHLCETIDFGSYPSWAAYDRQPVYKQLQLGPSLTNSRSHLSLLSEAFLEVLNYKAPPVYKVAANNDPTFVLEKISQIGNSLSTFILSSQDTTTEAETIYYNLLSLLSGLITLSATLDRASAEETLPDLIQSAQVALESLKSLLSIVSGPDLQSSSIKLSNLHGLTIARDSAQATRLACQWILSQNEREKGRDRSGQSGLPKEAVAQFKSLQALSEDLSNFGKTWTSSLQNVVASSRFQEEVRNALSEDSLKSLDTSKTTGLLIESWRTTLKGWQNVRWD